jgi:hypothetical protein
LFFWEKFRNNAGGSALEFLSFTAAIVSEDDVFTKNEKTRSLCVGLDVFILLGITA